MDKKLNIAGRLKRFDWVVKGLVEGPRSPFDVDLYRYDEVAVSPTVGAITSAWLLIIPRIEAICFAHLPDTFRRQISTRIESLRIHMKGFGGQSFLFEHGAMHSGSSVGCGVDQAHAHLVCLQSDLIKSALDSGQNLNWRQVSTSDLWSEIDYGREYYLVSDFNRAYVTYPKCSESQFFRKLIARDLGMADEWDYRLIEHEGNARDTIRMLSNT